MYVFLDSSFLVALVLEDLPGSDLGSKDFEKTTRSAGERAGVAFQILIS